MRSSRNPSAGHRSRRVAEVIRQIVAEFLAHGAKDPRIGLVTVTRVDVTPDLGKATIRFQAHGDDAERELTALGLTSVAPAVRFEVGKQLRLRTVPEIVFEADAGQQHASRIEELLAELRRNAPPEGGDAPAE